MILCFDTETTGFSPYDNDIIQLSAIDAETGETVINQYCGIKHTHDDWSEAAKINNISPEQIVDLPSIYDTAETEKVRDIFYNADMLMAYNALFDLNMLIPVLGEEWVKEQSNTYDIMLDYAQWYIQNKDPNFVCKNGEPRYSKLVAAAEMFDYTFDVHDSLEDVRATAIVFKGLQDIDVECKQRSYSELVEWDKKHYPWKY